MSNAPDSAAYAASGATRMGDRLEAWKLRLQQKISRETQIPEAKALIERYSGRQVGAADLRNARLLLRGAILPSMAAGDHDPALLLAMAGTVLRGSQCHVLSVGDAAYLAADRWGPVLDRMGISSVRLDTIEPKRGHKGHVVFGTVREAGLAWLRQLERDDDQPGPLQQLARRLAPGEGVSALSRGRLSFDRAIVLDADEAMGRTSMGGIAGTRREEAETQKRELIQDAFGLAAQLRSPHDFTRAQTGVIFTPEGRMRTQALSRLLGEAWTNPINTEFLVLNALETLVLWRRDEDYRITGELVEVLSPSLESRTRNAVCGIRATDMIAVREAPQDNRFAGKATNRTTVRAMLLRYSHLCGLARHAGRYAAELHAAYGVNVRASQLVTVPDEITGDVKGLVERVRKHVDDGQICIVESCSDGESDAVRDIMREAGIEMTAAPDWPQPDLDMPDGGVLWVVPRSDNKAVERLMSDPRAALVISLSGADFRRLEGTNGPTRIALVRTLDDAAGTSLFQRAAGLAGIRSLTAIARWRALQMAANDRDAFMRQQLFAFDQHCRRTVDFAQTARNAP